MKTIRSSILFFVVLLLAAPLLQAQDLSKYRHFTLGMSLTGVLERTDQKMANVKVIHSRPALIQEMTWWPRNVPGASLRSEGIEENLFDALRSQGSPGDVPRPPSHLLIHSRPALI